jgi:hypothetical protein
MKSKIFLKKAAVVSFPIRGQCLSLKHPDTSICKLKTSFCSSFHIFLVHACMCACVCVCEFLSAVLLIFK